MRIGWTVGNSRVTFNSRKEIWFRWFPDEDFMLRGNRSRDRSGEGGARRVRHRDRGPAWHEVDDPVTVSAWQVLARAVAPERALHLLRNRGSAGDPRHLDKFGAIALLPERVGLFALDAGGTPTLLGEGRRIDAALKYSFDNVKDGGWHTDFDAAIDAGNGSSADGPGRDHVPRWPPHGSRRRTIQSGQRRRDDELLEDAIANGGFAFLAQDTPTNNAPLEPTTYQAPRADLVSFLTDGGGRGGRSPRVATELSRLKCLLKRSESMSRTWRRRP